MAESGLPGFIGGTWFGLLAPARTPKPIIDRLHAETAALLNGAELRRAFEERDIIPGGNTPEEFGRFIASEAGKWKTLAARIGLQPECRPPPPGARRRRRARTSSSSAPA